MPASSRPERFGQPSPPFLFLLILLAGIWIAGGASRGDALGQIIVRGLCATACVATALFGRRPALRDVMPVFLFLGAAAALAMVQLIPLPPALWSGLPGRAAFLEAAAAAGIPQPWRPLAIVPDAAVNALFSLIVPATVLLLVSQLRDQERDLLPAIFLGLISGSALIGLLQFSGAGFDNPFINDSPGQVSGIFANRNHLALFLSIGCVLAPGWAFVDGRRSGWRPPVALCLVLLFALTILASGSRTGLALGIIGLVIGLILARGGIARTMRRYPRWATPALIAGIVAILGIAVLASVAADRAVSIDRIIGIDPGQDMRGRGLPVVLSMIGTYFPVGSGLGGFDPIFRMHEPFSLLKVTYFNHAHNDWLEVVLDAGLPGLLLLLAGLCWWGWASTQAWQRGSDRVLARTGSATLLLVMVASLFDYPARTPMVMVVMAVAGAWLSAGRAKRNRSALPDSTQHL